MLRVFVPLSRTHNQLSQSINFIFASSNLKSRGIVGGREGINYWLETV